MYYDYFGLKQPPFRITPDTSLFYPGGDRGAVLEALIYAILNGEGMVKVVGEVGSGKTMLCRMLEKELPDEVEIVYLANPSLSPENILHAIAFELKLGVEADTSRLQVMHNLQEYLLKRHAENRQVVVFVEEAQAMPIATLEEIRLLSNLETQQSKLLQIVMFGQPELDELMSRPEIRQLKERITYSFQLNPFVSEHIHDYVNTRLRASGYRSGEIFDKAAIRQIERHSKGLLRRVNILADKSLLAAYAGNTHQVTAKHVKQAARDSEFATTSRQLLWIGLVTASILLVLVVMAGLWQMTDKGATTTVSVQEPSPGITDAGVDSGPMDELEETTSDPVEQMLVSAHTEEQSGLDSDAPESLEGDISSLNSVTYASPDDAQRAGTDESIKQDLPSESTKLKRDDVKVSDTFKMVSGSATGGRRNPSTDPGLNTQLLDLSTLYELQDLNDERLSNQESDTLRKQLKDLPPEVALYQDSAQFSDICQLCWSILYRPVIDPENL